MKSRPNLELLASRCFGKECALVELHRLLEGGKAAGEIAASAGELSLRVGDQRAPVERPAWPPVLLDYSGPTWRLGLRRKK